MMTSVFKTAAIAIAAIGTAGVRVTCVHAEAVSRHPVVQELTTKGIALDEGVVVQLTTPVLQPGMTGKQQLAAIEALVGKASLNRFLDDRLTAKQMFRVTDGQNLGKAGVVRRLDQYFVVHGDMALFRDEALLDNFMAEEKKRDAEEEPNRKPEKFKQYLESIDEAGEKPADGQPYVYRYRYALIDKVVISGLVRGQSYSDEQFMIESSVSAADLLNDASDPTQWQSIPRGARGDSDLGPATSFRGLAGYLQVTDLEFLEGAVLVEVHGVLIEPEGWFGGRDLLTPKLPIVAEQNLRDLRRKVKRLKASASARN